MGWAFGGLAVLAFAVACASELGSGFLQSTWIGPPPPDATHAFSFVNGEGVSYLTQDQFALWFRLALMSHGAHAVFVFFLICMAVAERLHIGKWPGTDPS
jgi:hypothetical protein